MGASESSDLDKLRVQEIATEVSGQFAKEFLIWYKEAISKQVKATSDELDDYRFSRKPDYLKRRLLTAPISSRPIKTGYIHKLGYNVRNWKRRYFIANNQQNNYIIKYYEDELMQKEKGKINCFGYTVKSFTPEEERLHGPYGIKLLHHEDSTKRVWVLRCENAQQQSQWIQVFMKACKHTVQDQQQNPLIHEAFQKALQATKATYGYFGTLPIITCSELDALLQLTKQILHREILDEYIVVQKKKLQQHLATTSSSSSSHHSHHGGHSSPLLTTSSSSITTNPQYLSFLQHLKLTVHSHIVPIVTSTWKSCLDAVAQINESSYRDILTASLPALLQAEDRLLTNFSKKFLTHLILPMHEELMEMTYLPWLTTSMRYYQQAYSVLLQQVYLQVKPVLLCTSVHGLDEWLEESGGGRGTVGGESVDSVWSEDSTTTQPLPFTLTSLASLSLRPSSMSFSQAPLPPPSSPLDSLHHPPPSVPVYVNQPQQEALAQPLYGYQKECLETILAKLFAHVDDAYYPADTPSMAISLPPPYTPAIPPLPPTSRTVEGVCPTTGELNLLPPLYDIFWYYYSHEILGNPDLMNVLEYAHPQGTQTSGQSLTEAPGPCLGDAPSLATPSPLSSTMRLNSYHIYTHSMDDMKALVRNLTYTLHYLLTHPQILPAKLFTPSSTTSSSTSSSSATSSATSPMIAIFFYFLTTYVQYDLTRVLLTRLHHTFHALMIAHLQERIYPNGLDMINTSADPQMQTFPASLLQYPCINEQLIHVLLQEQYEEQVIQGGQLMEKCDHMIQGMKEWMEKDLKGTK